VKFDAIVGNPPYQNKTGSLWKPITYRFKYYSDNIQFITPRAFVNGHSFTKYNNRIKLIDYTANDHFTVAKDICRWTLCKYTETTVVVCINGDRIDINLNKYKYLPYKLYSAIDFEIFKKLYKYQDKFLTRDSHRSYGIAIPSSLHIDTSGFRVTSNPKEDPHFNCANNYCMIINSTEVNKAEEYIKSDLFKYQFKIWGCIESGGTALKKFVKWGDEIEFTKEELEHIKSPR